MVDRFLGEDMGNKICKLTANGPLGAALALASVAMSGCFGSAGKLNVTTKQKPDAASPVQPQQTPPSPSVPPPDTTSVDPQVLESSLLQLGFPDETRTLITDWFQTLPDPEKQAALSELRALVSQVKGLDTDKRSTLVAKMNDFVMEAMGPDGSKQADFAISSLIDFILPEIEKIIADVEALKQGLANLSNDLNKLNNGTKSVSDETSASGGTAANEDASQTSSTPPQETTDPDAGQQAGGDSSGDSGQQAGGDSSGDSGQQAGGDTSGDSGQQAGGDSSGDTGGQAANPSYSVGGTLAGLRAAANLRIQNNGGDELILADNGAFQFSQDLQQDSTYAVTIATQPIGQICVLSEASGTVTAAVTSISIVCSDTVQLTLSPDTASGINLARGAAPITTTLTLTNTGSETSQTLQAPLLAGDAPSSFAIVADTCTGTTLAPAPGPGHTCTFGVILVASANQSYAANVSLTDGAATSNLATLSGSASGLAFITTWQTTAANETLTIPLFLGATYNFIIDWGDGTLQHWNTDASPSHSYASPGTHTISISGLFPRIYFNQGGDRDKIRTVEQWGSIAWTSMDAAFRGATNIEIQAEDTPNLSGVTSLRQMFQSARSVQGSPSVGDWNVSTATASAFADAVCV
jgi:hypothetical protein